MTFEIPTLNTDRLRLRAFEAGDLMQANLEVMRFLVDGCTHSRVEVWRIMAGFLRHWLLRLRDVGCVKRDSGQFVGSVEVRQPLDWPEPELAYALDQPILGAGLCD
jgi:hypothetical protein